MKIRALILASLVANASISGEQLTAIAEFSSEKEEMQLNHNTDKVIEAIKFDAFNVRIKILTGGKELTRLFHFPSEIRDFVVKPHLQGASVIIAASPLNSNDWFWGLAYLKEGSDDKGSITKWKESPPNDAILLGVQTTGGDSVVIHASKFIRDSMNTNSITSYAYVNHCPIPTNEKDTLGHLYSGEIGGELRPEFADQNKPNKSEMATPNPPPHEF